MKDIETALDGWRSVERFRGDSKGPIHEVFADMLGIERPARVATVVRNHMPIAARLRSRWQIHHERGFDPEISVLLRADDGEGFEWLVDVTVTDISWLFSRPLCWHVADPILSDDELLEKLSSTSRNHPEAVASLGRGAIRYWPWADALSPWPKVQAVALLK